MPEKCICCNTREEIYEVIPNRYPFMILNSLKIEDENAIGTIKLKGDDWFFECHYPGNPILPMSLLIESMTQTFSAIFLSKSNENEIPVISSLSGESGTAIRMKESAKPEDSIKLVASLNSFRRGIAKGICKAYKNEKESPIIELEIVEVLPSKMVQMS